MKNIEIKEILYDDKDYPKSLKNINKPPKKLYVIGNQKLLNEKSIAIVGSRNCSEYGMKQCKIFSKSISKAGITVVSGLAKGIDSIAHRNSYSEIGKTIAVVGCGVNVVYPPENKELYNRIIENDGCIVSEQPLSSEPNLKKFPFRNRIIAGLSMGTIVIEAKFRSGSSITARYAFEQRKNVFCIPHSINDVNGVGTNILIQKGAKLVTKPSQIGRFYNVNIQDCYDIEENKPNEEHDEGISSKNIEEEYLSIYSLLVKKIMNANQIAMQLNEPIAIINQKLTMMEIKGYIKMLPGNEFAIKEKLRENMVKNTSED